MFPVFTRSGEVTVAVNLLSREVILDGDELSKLKIFHRFLFSNVLRLEKDPMDFYPECSTMGYLVVPLNKGKCPNHVQVTVNPLKQSHDWCTLHNDAFFRGLKKNM